MNSSYRLAILGELVNISSSKRIYSSDYVNFGVPFYRSKEIIEKSNGSKVTTDLYISFAKFNEIKSKFGAPKKGDLLITSVGTLGVPLVIDDDSDFYFKDGNLIWFKDFDKNLDPYYLYHWLLSKEGKTELEKHTIGSTQKAFTIQGLKKIKINLPTIEIQQKIAKILGDLNQKIEFNRRMNETLEQIGQALFKKYFIDNSERSGWKKVSLDEVANFLNGLALQKYPLKHGERGLPVVKIRELTTGITESSDYVGLTFPEDYIVDNGDFLFAWSGTLMTKIWTGGPGALNQHIFKVSSKNFPKWFYYHCGMDPLFQTTTLLSK